MIRFETINDAGRRLAQLIEQEQIPFEGEAVVFVGALGICVRRMAELVHDKYTDPAVVCVDTTGRYVIPVLGGHVGGANELARQIALVTGGEAVITTQSDNLGLWPLDTLARTNDWGMTRLSRAAMNHAIATFVGLRPTALVVECDDSGARRMTDTLPQHVKLFRNYTDYKAAVRSGAVFELLLIVSPRCYPVSDIPTLQYFPRCLHLGVGCQKDAPVEIAPQLLAELRAAGYAPEAIATISTIELKQNEPLLAALSQVMPWVTKHIYPAEVLAKIKIPNPSQRVFEVTGCYGVAEASAKAHDIHSKLVVEKQKGSLSKNGKISHYTYALAEDAVAVRQGHVEIVGAGPGDPELVSVRGRHFLENADLILYAGSLVPRQLTACAKPGAVVRNSATLNLEEQFLLMKEFYDRGNLVVRLHTGDPCIYGAIQEQMALFDAHGMDYHITPGISSFLAAAAELRSQFTIPEECQTIILTRGEGRTPMPEREKLHMLATHQSTMCIFLSATLVRQVQDELLEGGYAPETPVAVCHKLTWPGQQIFRGELRNLAQMVEEQGLTLTTLIVVGKAVGNRSGVSRLYDSEFSHLFRQGNTAG